jgi:hypothetical protein
MKLPDFNTTPAQAVGGIQEARYELTQLGHQVGRAWAAGTQLVETVGGLGLEMAKGVTQVQHAEAVADVAEADAAAKAKAKYRVLVSKDELAAIYGGAESIPKEISERVGGLDKLVADPDHPDSEGLVQGRTDIPAWAVNPDLYKKEMLAQARSAAEKITLPGYRAEFLRQAEKSINVEYQNLQGQAEQEHQDWKNANLQVQALRLVNSGQPGLAHSFVAQMNIPEPERVKLNEHLDLLDAQYQLNKPMLAQDFVGMGNLVEGLKSGQTQFGYLNGKGEVEKVDVTAMPEQARRGLAMQMERQLKAFHGAAQQEAKQQQAQIDDRYRSQFVDMAVAGNWGGMRSFLAHPPADMSGKVKKELLQVTEGQLDRLKRPSPEQTTLKNVFTSALLEAADEAANGEEPSVPNPVDPSRTVDFRTTDLGELFRQGYLGEGDYKKFLKQQSDLKSGKTIVPRNVDVKDGERNVTVRLGVTDKGEAANVQAAFRHDLMQEESRRGKRMNRNEILEYSESWVGQGRKQYGWGPFKNVGSSPALADVPLSYLRPIQTVLSKYPEDQYPRTAAGMGNLYRERLQPLEEPVQSAWVDTKEADADKFLQPNKLIGYVGAIDLQRKSLHDELVNLYHVRNPSDTELAQYFFQKLGMLKRVVFGRKPK